MAEVVQDRAERTYGPSAEVKRLVREIEDKQAVVGRFLTNSTGEEFPPDAIQYPKQIAEAKARVEQITEVSYEEVANAVGRNKVQEQPVSASNSSTLLADAQIIQTELRDPATASGALEAQAFSLQRDMNFEAAQASATMESAALRSAAYGVETEQLTAEESREELARKAELYAGLVARDYRTATDAAVEKFASGVRKGSAEIDLSQAYEALAGLSVETAEGMARTRHESVGAALQPLFFEAEKLGIRVHLGSASLAETVKIHQEVATPKRGISG